MAHRSASDSSFPLNHHGAIYELNDLLNISTSLVHNFDLWHFSSTQFYMQDDHVSTAVIQQKPTHYRKLFKKRFRLNISKYSFGNRVIGNWNSLSVDCVHCKIVNTFKKHLSTALESGAV